MNCLTPNDKHIFYLYDQSDEDNYYMCRVCGIEYRINKDIDYKNGEA